VLNQGLVILINANPAVQAILCGAAAGLPEGNFVQLPADKDLPTWTFTDITPKLNTTLQSTFGLRSVRWQVDCFGKRDGRGLDATRLATAIEGVLNGFQGTLSDEDSTYVSFCETTDTHNFFDKAARSFRRMIEFTVTFAQDPPTA
jgi:hypothetical protein